MVRRYELSLITWFDASKSCNNVFALPFLLLAVVQALYRINRDISLSRAIGDFDLKKYGVIGRPDVTTHTFQPTSSQSTVSSDNDLTFLVVATDGVWDVLPPGECAAELQGVVDDIAKGVGASDGKSVLSDGAIATMAAQRLVRRCCGVSSNNDDVTAVVLVMRQSD